MANFTRNFSSDGPGFNPRVEIRKRELVGGGSEYYLLYTISGDGGKLVSPPVEIKLAELTQASQDGITAAHVEAHSLAVAKLAAKDFR